MGHCNDDSRVNNLSSRQGTYYAQCIREVTAAFLDINCKLVTIQILIMASTTIQTNTNIALSTAKFIVCSCLKICFSGNNLKVGMMLSFEAFLIFFQNQGWKILIDYRCVLKLILVP